MIDAHSDTSCMTMQALSQRVGNDSFCKIAEYVQTKDSPSDINAYADRDGKLFACHTKEATLVNYAYFVDQRDSYSRNQRDVVQKRFDEKLAFWDITDAKADIEAAVTKTASVKYAMEIQGDKLFGYQDAESLVKAASEFYANRHKFPYENRKTAARTLILEGEKLAARYPNDVVLFMNKAAGWALPSKEGILSVLHRRAYDTQYKDTSALEKIAAAAVDLVKDESGQVYDLEKVAAFMSAVDAYDRLTKVARRYADYGVPEEYVFSDTDLTKTAAEMHSKVKLTNGSEITLSDSFFEKLSSADPDLAKSIMGNHEKAAEILPTLPRPDADYIIETCG